MKSSLKSGKTLGKHRFEISGVCRIFFRGGRGGGHGRIKSTQGKLDFYLPQKSLVTLASSVKSDLLCRQKAVQKKKEPNYHLEPGGGGRQISGSPTF